MSETDTRPWLVIGGPCEGKMIRWAILDVEVIRHVHVPVVTTDGFDFIRYRIDRADHLLEYDPD